MNWMSSDDISEMIEHNREDVLASVDAEYIAPQSLEDMGYRGSARSSEE